VSSLPIALRRHGRACPGHPRLAFEKKKDLDARAKRGHDEDRFTSATASCPPSLRGTLATKQSSLGLGLLCRSLRSTFSHRKIRAKEVDKRNHDGHGKEYVALLQDHAFILPRLQTSKSHTLPLLRPQSHTRRVTIGKLDAGLFEHTRDRREIIARRHAASLFEVDDDAGRDHGAVSQHALIHIDEAARGAALGGRKRHMLIVQLLHTA